jgi:hypothetical protein
MFVTLKKDFLGQVAGKVIDVADADAQALITSGVAEACPNDPLAPIIQKSMEALSTNVTKSLNSVVEITLQRFQEAQEQARKNSIPASSARAIQAIPSTTLPTGSSTRLPLARAKERAPTRQRSIWRRSTSKASSMSA